MMVQNSLTFSALLLIFSLFELVKSADNGNVECIPLKDCPKLLHLLREVPVQFSSITLIKSSICNGNERDPKVWCAQTAADGCEISETEEGRCVPADECPEFLKTLQNSNGLSPETKDYVEKYWCTNSKSPKRMLTICCPVKNAGSTEKLLPDPNSGQCGRQSLQLASKLVGGRITGLDEFPWTALLQYQLRARTLTPCGGSLISSKYVVTAAHCVDEAAKRAAGKLTHVILGEFDTRNETDCVRNADMVYCSDSPLKAAVEETVIHPQWYTRPSGQLNHDIALVRLASPVTFSNSVRPICLPPPNLVIKEKQELVVTGWGQTENDSASFVKLKAIIPMANRFKCVERYRSEKRLQVAEGEVCVGGLDGVDSCTGDSGGPLMIGQNQNDVETWFLAGIVSFGPNQPCGVPDYPGLYTYLPKYVDWISQAVKP